MKKVIVTGGSGFMGTNMVEYLIENGYSVLNIDIKKPKIDSRETNWVQCDINDLEPYRKIVEDYNPSYFIHLAARTDLDETKKLTGYKTNILGVENTVEVIKETGIQRSLFASSRMVCKIDYQPKNDFDYCPPNLYGESKAQGEKIIREASLGCEWMIFRPTSIWGEFFDIPYRVFFDKIQKGQYFHPGDRNPEKTFGYVGNSIFQISKLLSAPNSLIHQKTIYLGDYPPLNLREWANLIADNMESGKIHAIPFSILKVLAFLGDTWKLLKVGEPPLTTFRLNNLVTNMVYDTRDLEKICGELPFSLDGGVANTVKWMKS